MAVTQGEAPGGSPALVDSTGKLYMRDRFGDILRVPPDQFDTMVSEGGLRLASSDDIALFEQKELEESTSGTGAFAEAAGRGLVEPGLAGFRVAGRLATETGARLGGASQEEAERIARESPFEPPTGAEVVSTVVKGVGGEAAVGYDEAARRRARGHPGLATAGEILGSAVGSGGVGGAGSLPVRVGVGMVQGASAGAGTAAEDAFIEDKPLTSEMLFAGAGLGGALGAGFELGAAGLGAGFRRLRGTKKPPPPDAAPPIPLGERIADRAEEMSAYATWRSWGVNAPGAKITAKNGRAFKEKLLRSTETSRNLFIREVVDSETGETVARLASQGDAGAVPVHVSNSGEALRRLGLAVDATSDEIARMSRIGDKAVTTMRGLRSEINDAADLASHRVATEVIGRAASRGTLSAQSAADMLERQHRLTLDALGPDPSLEGLWRAARDLDYEARAAQTRLAAGQPAANLELEQMARIYHDAHSAAVDKVLAGSMRATNTNAPPINLPPGVSSMAELKTQFHDLMTFAQQGTLREIEEGLRRPGLTPYMVGGVTAARGPVAGITSTVITETARSAQHKLDYAIARSAGWVAKRFRRQVDKDVADAVAPKPKPKGLRPKPSVVPPAATFAAEDEDRREAFSRHVQELSSAAADLIGLSQQVGDNLKWAATATPITNGLYTMTAIRAVQFLAAKLPQNAISLNVFDPKNPTMDVSDSEIARFALYWEAVNDPMSVLRSLSDGMLVFEQVEALREVYPTLLVYIQRQILVALAEADEPPPYDKRAQLDLLLGLNGAGEPALSPQFQMTLNASAAIADAEEAATAGKPRPMSDTKARATASRTQTLSAQIETDLA